MGGGKRSMRADANVPNQAEFREIAWKTLTRTLIHKAPVSEKQIWNVTLEIN